MEFRRMVVNLDIDAPSPALVRCAEDLARRFDADLIGVAAAEPYPIMAGGRGAVVTASLHTGEREAIEARLQTLEADFVRQLSPGTRGEWRGAVTTPNHVLAALAVGADLIVIGSEAAGGFRRRVDIGELVITAGRPVLVAARDVESIKGESIVIGWKDTREARRAVADALPLLRKASRVVAVSIEEGDRARQQESLGDLLGWLERHGIDATGDLQPAQGDAAQQLENSCGERAADLLVTGGYGRSRLQEWLFGGMTHGLLSRHAISRLMSN